MINPIIPSKQIFYNYNKKEIILWGNICDKELDYEAIATFASLGFMLDDDTFIKEIKVLKSATNYEVSSNNIIKKVNKYWDWHYTPQIQTFAQTLEEFKTIFEKSIYEKTSNKRIVLPLSGGIDSRTLIVPLRDRKDLNLCSYEFEGGYPETNTAKIISDKYNIPLYAQKIQKGYLWNKLENFTDLNNCFTDFTHPRQVAAINQWEGLGDVILLGHWGDVLFDKQVDIINVSYDEQLIQLKTKLLKPDGVELASDLWQYWGCKGSFENYVTDRLNQLYGNITIDHPSSRMRAFKSLYWAPRWTSINLSIFGKAGEIILPYYSDEMCKFICTVPERFLAERKIQIEYIKKYCPEIARISLQQYYPLNLYQHHWFRNPVYYPVRALRKMKRVLQRNLFNTPELIIRNWELQFLGDQNFIHLKKKLLDRRQLYKFIPQSIIKDYLEKFQADPVKYAFSISMLLTLVVFSERYIKK